MRSAIKAFFLTTSLLLLSVSQSFSAISGQVLDAYSKDPISGATLYILPGETVLTSDADGRFVYDTDAEYSEIYIAVYRLGYFRLNISGVNSQNVIIQLEPKPIHLESITLLSTSSNNFADEIAGERLLENLPADVADVFANTPGFGVVRKGSYGADPVINGFKREQLLVQVDGIGVTECACPNRMDPLTTQIQPEDLSEVQVVEGPYSLRYGSTIGGVINLKLDKPRPGSKTQGWYGNVFARYESNGDGYISRATLEHIGKGYGTRISGGIKNFNEYKDGNGNEVPSGFDVIEFSLLQSFKIEDLHDIDIIVRKSFAEDIIYAGLPMDAEKDDATFAQATWLWKNPISQIAYFELSGYTSYVDHIMHNHNRPNFSKVDAVATTESATSGLRFEMLYTGLPKGIFYYGMDYDIVFKDGNRKRIVFQNPCNGMVMDPPATFEDKIWQDSQAATGGAFGEYQVRLNPQTRFSVAARVDQFLADVSEPASQFNQYYGQILSNDEFAFSASSSLEHQLNSINQLKFAIGYGTRFPSITELYINHLTVGQDAYEYFGNPDLKSEKNLQLTLGLDTKWDRFESSFSIYSSFLTDYISSQVDNEMPRVYVPCNDPQYTKRFYNVDEARKYGFNWALELYITEKLQAQTSAAYTWAQNITEDEALPEIPPLELYWNLRYDLELFDGSWVMLQGRHVDKQERIAQRFSEKESEAFNVFHLRAGSRINRQLEVIAGVRNIFDEQYREHLNRAYKNQFNPSPLYEPGRNIYLQLKAEF